MIDYTLASPNWQREKSRLYFYLDALANESLGITGRPKMRAGEEEFIQACSTYPAHDREMVRGLAESSEVHGALCVLPFRPCGQIAS